MYWSKIAYHHIKLKTTLIHWSPAMNPRLLLCCNFRVYRRQIYRARGSYFLGCSYDRRPYISTPWTLYERKDNCYMRASHDRRWVEAETGTLPCSWYPIGMRSGELLVAGYLRTIPRPASTRGDKRLANSTAEITYRG